MRVLLLTVVLVSQTATPIFRFETDGFWLNLHHFLYVLGRAENEERNASREAVAGAPGDQQAGFEKLTAREQTIWREAVGSYAMGRVRGISFLTIRCPRKPLL